MIVNFLLALAGCGLLLVGLWLIWAPLALIVAGLGLLALGFFREVPDGKAG